MEAKEALKTLKGSMLIAAIDKFLASDGELRPHLMSGRMAKTTYSRYLAIPIADHLSRSGKTVYRYHMKTQTDAFRSRSAFFLVKSDEIPYFFR